MANWGFDTRSNRYRDRDSGRFLGKRAVLDLRDRLVAAADTQMRTLASQAATGAIAPVAFRSGMRDLLRNVHGAEAIFGRGGIHAMTSADWGRLGGTLRTQYAYLDGFVADLANGALSEAQAMARAGMYANGGTLSFEQARASAWGLAGQLPCYPADGGTQCLSNCRCRWDIRQTETTVDAYWRLSAGESCPGCQGRAATYAPFSVPKPYAVPDATPVRLSAMRRVA